MTYFNLSVTYFNLRVKRCSLAEGCAKISILFESVAAWILNACLLTVGKRGRVPRMNISYTYEIISPWSASGVHLKEIQPYMNPLLNAYANGFWTVMDAWVMRRDAARAVTGEKRSMGFTVQDTTGRNGRKDDNRGNRKFVFYLRIFSNYFLIKIHKNFSSLKTKITEL